MSDVERTPGVIVPRYCSLDQLIAPIRGELSTWLWWVDVQSGPITSNWRNDEKNQLLIDRLFIYVPEFRNTDTTAWNRGFVPKLHHHIHIGEWTYFYATNCAPVEFPNRAAYSATLTRPDELFRWLALCDDLYVMHVAGWWEIYSNNSTWQTMWLNHFPDAFLRSWKKSGEPPMNQ